MPATSPRRSRGGSSTASSKRSAPTSPLSPGGHPGSSSRRCGRLAPIAPLLAGDITALDAPAAGLALSLAGRDVTGSTRHRLLFDNRTFATYLVYWGEASETPLDVTLTLPVEGVPVLYRLADGARLTASDYSRDAETGRVRARVPADRRADARGFQRRRVRGVRRAERRLGGAPVVGGGDHRPPPAAAAGAGRAGAQLHRLGAHASSISVRR